MKHGSNLYRRNATYYARQAVPADLHGHIRNEDGKVARELRRSLRTNDKQEARRLLPAVLNSWQHMFARMRSTLASQVALARVQNTTVAVPPSPDVEARVLRQIYDDVLGADDHERLTRRTSEDNLAALNQVAASHGLSRQVVSNLTSSVLTGSGMRLAQNLRVVGDQLNDVARDDLHAQIVDVYLAENAAEISAAANESNRDDLRADLGRGDTTTVQGLTMALLAQEGCALPRGSIAFSQFAHKVQRVLLEAFERRTERDQGDFRGTPTDPLLRPPTALDAAPSGRTPQLGATRSLDQLFDMYAKENRNGVKEHSLTQARQSVRWLADYVGSETHADNITKADVAEWIDHLREFPTRAAQIQAFKGMTFREIVDANGAHARAVLTVKTIRRMVSEVSGFLSWMENRGYIRGNPARGQTPRLDKKSANPRRSFREQELALLFCSPLFAGCESSDVRHGGGPLIIRDGHYWMPLLALLTGARMGELAQLHVGDVAVAHGHWVIRITDVDPNSGASVETKSLKTRSSKRIVPLHTALVKGGFVEFVSSRAAAGDPRLFPEFKRNERGEFSRYSRAFADYLKRIGLKVDAGLTFHSFRHTFMDALRRGGVGKHERELLAGHARHDMNDMYGEEVDGTVAQRAGWIERMTFGSFVPDAVFYEATCSVDSSACRSTS